MNHQTDQHRVDIENTGCPFIHVDLVLSYSEDRHHEALQVWVRSSNVVVVAWHFKVTKNNNCRSEARKEDGKQS